MLTKITESSAGVVKERKWTSFSVTAQLKFISTWLSSKKKELPRSFNKARYSWWMCCGGGGEGRGRNEIVEYVFVCVYMPGWGVAKINHETTDAMQKEIKMNNWLKKKEKKSYPPPPPTHTLHYVSPVLTDSSWTVKSSGWVKPRDHWATTEPEERRESEQLHQAVLDNDW